MEKYKEGFWFTKKSKNKWALLTKFLMFLLLIGIFCYLDDTERHLEQLHRGVLEDPGLDNPYIVLSQHQMQNLGKYTPQVYPPC